MLRIPIEIPATVLAGDPARVVDIVVERGLRVHVVGLDDLILDRVDQAAAQRTPTVLQAIASLGMRRGG